MSIIEGILNYTIASSIVIIFIIILRSYKKSLKTNLSQSVSSFFSVYLCIYYIFSFDNLYFIFEYADSFNLHIIVFVLIVLFIFIFVYLFIKFIIKRLFKYTRIIHLLNKDYRSFKKLNFIFVLIRKSLFMMYIVTILTISYTSLYYTGITKPIVTTSVIKTSQIDILTEINKIEEVNYSTSSFTDLFSQTKMLDKIYLTSDLLSQLKTYENQFVDDIYPKLPKESKVLVDEKFNGELTSKGILTVLIEEDLYIDILDDGENNFAKKLFMKIPYLNDYLYKDEVVTNDLLAYIEKNNELIIWLDSQRTLIEDIKNNELVVINQFKDDYSSFKNIEDKDNKFNIDEINSSIERYYYIHDFSLKIIEDYNIIDVDMFLQNGENLDVIIRAFNKAYKENEFKEFKLEFLNAYQLTERYLANYDTYSKSINTNIDPKARISAAALNREVEIGKYLKNERTLNQLLIYLNDKCYKSIDRCNEDKTIELIDMLLWGYFTEEIDEGKQIRLSSTKINDLYLDIDKMDGYNKASIKFQLIKLNDKLYPYIEEHYNKKIFDYDILKVIYKQENYTSEEFSQNIQKLIK